MVLRETMGNKGIGLPDSGEKALLSRSLEMLNLTMKLFAAYI
jgi:hypothetical protein